MGYSKTIAALLFIIVGWLGFGEFFTSENIGVVVDHLFSAFGIVWSIYLRYKAGKNGQLDEINALGFKV